MAVSDEKRQLIEELRKEWRMMWRERIDDKVRAEGISDKEYPQLFVERGRVIIATRKFKPPDFLEILQQYKLVSVLPPHPSVGGWGKFVRTSLRSQQSQVGRRRRIAPPELCPKKVQQQKKKGGRGWLHFTR